MKNTLKKTLSIILAILMVATLVPMAFAADEHVYISDCDIYCDHCGLERVADVGHILEDDGDIKTDVNCVYCSELIYEASDRWSVGDYYGRTGNISHMASNSIKNDSITSYLVMDTVPGETYKLDFSWAISHGFIQYGSYYLRFYHNGEEKILHDFTRTPNPYVNILDESYTFTAEGDQQVFKWVFEKVKSGSWATGGRPIYLDEFELKHLDHDIVTTDEAVAPTCTETGLTEGSRCLYCDDATIAQEVVPALDHDIIVDAYVAPKCEETGLTEGSHCSRCEDKTVAQEVVPELGHDIITDEAIAPKCEETGLTEGSHCSRCDDMTVEQEVIPALGHADEDGDGICDNGGEQLYCEDCGRPVHEGFYNNLICLIIMFINLVKTMF